jgi:hypothetical protein
MYINIDVYEFIKVNLISKQLCINSYEMLVKIKNPPNGG